MPSISAATRSILNGTIRCTHGPKSSNSYFCLSPNLKRRRQMAASGAMPAFLAAEFTRGEDAALCIIADEYRVRGSSDLSLDEIADKASVGRSAAKSALRKARELGLITVQNRGRLTNVVRIIAPESAAGRRGKAETRRHGADGHVRLQGPLFCSGNRSGLQGTRRGRAARRDPPFGRLRRLSRQPSLNRADGMLRPVAQMHPIGEVRGSRRGRVPGG
jgi:hypothetical protein